MSNSINRRDIGYTIISRFEETIRNFITHNIRILFGDFKEGIPNGIIEKVMSRSQQSDFETPLDFLEYTDFPDLKEIILYKGVYKYYFSSYSLSQAEFIQIMDELYNIRCKIAHVRGMFSSIDTDQLFENTRDISHAMEEHGANLLNFLDELENNPEKYTTTIPDNFINENFLKNTQLPNNLPTPDYEFEGGFVGREDDIKKIIKLVTGDIHRVITITGAGGVGKTAIALKVIQNILKDMPNIFDGIIWLSAKEKKLSALGIEDIEPTLKNYDELLDMILEVMGYGIIESTLEQKEKDVNTAFDFLHDRLLIVIDNFETVTDDRINNFILDPHPNVKILVTSRRGLGQVERRYELNQLKEKEAILLFRKIALDKKLLSLSKLDDETIKIYVQKVACYPLAIKWVIGHVAIGKDINSIVNLVTKEKSDIALFCFDQIYNSLTQQSKKVLCALSLFDIPPQAGVLKYVTNLSQEEFEDSISELILVSLVIQEQTKTEHNDITTRYNLLSLTRGFVNNQLDQNTILKREIEERMRAVQNTVEEAERAKKQYRFSLHNLGATTEEEKLATLLAQTAYQKYQGGRYAEALENYKRASEIAPRFASIYRNWAVMESNEGHSIEADQLMKKASELNPNDTQIWLTWGNMKRKENKIKESLDCYLKAKEIDPNDYVVLNSLGQAKSRLGDYSEADQLFREALMNKANVIVDSVKHQVINRTSIADNLGRWAESLSRDRKFKDLCEMKKRRIRKEESKEGVLNIVNRMKRREGNQQE